MPHNAPVLWLVAPADGALRLDPARRFWKELIREGNWINANAGFTLAVDHARLERWLERFAAMADAGIRVPLPWGHSYDPRDNAGFLEKLELRDHALWGLLSVPSDDDADRLGSTVSAVSVSINPNFVDGTGRAWGEVIEHVALTNYPVVIGQGGFVQADNDPDPAPHPAITLQLAPPETVRPETGIPQEEETVEHRTSNSELRTQDPELGARNSEPATDGSQHSTVNAQLSSRKPKTENPQPVPPADHRSPNTDHRSSTAEMHTRLYLLELERAERDLDDALALGKFTRPAAEALRSLIAAGIERRFAFGLPDAALADAALGNHGTATHFAGRNGMAVPDFPPPSRRLRAKTGTGTSGASGTACSMKPDKTASGDVPVPGFARWDRGPGFPAPDIAQLARAIIAATPAGAAVDMTEHTRVFAIPQPGAPMTDARAAQLAKENRKLAGV